MRPRQRAFAVRQSGLTLVEAALIVCVGGVILAVFVPTFLRHVRTSKVAEAAEQLQVLHLAAASYFDTRHESEDGKVAQCFPAAAGPAPALPSQSPVDVDFANEETPGHATWSALGFAPERPLRYRYTFIPHTEGCSVRGRSGESVLTLRAEGDLDGDGVLSTFERSAMVEDLQLSPVGPLRVTDRVE